MREIDRAQCRVERRKKHIGGKHARLRQSVEKRRFAGIGVADQRDNRIRHAFAAFTMQLARPLDLLEFVLDARDALADQSPVGFELALAGTAEESKAAALAFEMG